MPPGGAKAASLVGALAALLPRREVLVRPGAASCRAAKQSEGLSPSSQRPLPLLCCAATQDAFAAESSRVCLAGPDADRRAQRQCPARCPADEAQQQHAEQHSGNRRRRSARWPCASASDAHARPRKDRATSGVQRSAASGAAKRPTTSSVERREEQRSWASMAGAEARVGRDGAQLPVAAAAAEMRCCRLQRQDARRTVASGHHAGPSASIFASFRSSVAWLHR